MRRARAKRREIQPDPRYKSVVIAKFINYLMERGKKEVARKVVYDTFDYIKEKTKIDPLAIFDKAIKNVAPVLEIKAKRVGGANYQIPMEVRGDRKQMLAFRWILESASNKKGKPMHIKLASELLDASKGEGASVKHRADVHRMAEANKAFAHFA